MWPRPSKRVPPGASEVGFDRKRPEFGFARKKHGDAASARAGRRNRTLLRLHSRVWGGAHVECSKIRNKCRTMEDTVAINITPAALSARAA